MVDNSTDVLPVRSRSGKPDAAEQLTQGWSEAETKLFLETTQGSKLVPYSWYKNLEQANSQKPFNDREHMDDLGYLFRGASKSNNEQLPIGFVIESLNSGTQSLNGRSEAAETTRIPRLTDVSKAYPQERWLGLSCAACHTGQVEYKGYMKQIYGAPTLADTIALTTEMRDAFRATLGDEAKFKRFAGKVLDQPTKEQEQRLKGNVKKYTEALDGLVIRSKPPTPSGHGRLDAFGILSNEIVGTAMDHKENIRVPDGPVSYPSIWNTPNYDWVQWNSFSATPLGRNIGEVLGVFAELDLKEGSPTIFQSSAEVRNLNKLEENLKKLESPKWPDEFGKLDAARVERGRALFQTESCIKCHNVENETYKNKYGRELIWTKQVPLDVIGTDPTTALNFANRMANPGAFKSALGGKDQVPLPLLLEAGVKGITGAAFKREGVQTQAEMAKLNDCRENLERTNEELKGYKASNLRGIWATAPYLHNGSVPTLYDLLQPADRRPKTFNVGNREFDPVKVGFDTVKGKSVLNTELKGNSNRGHEYGSKLNEQQKLDLIEYLKSR